MAMIVNIGSKMPMNRTSESSKKASSIALHNRGAATLGRREGEIMTFGYCAPVELFHCKP
jgi:hypothetical protein